MKQKWLASLLTLSALALAACSNEETPSADTDSADSNQETVMIEDSNNNSVEVPASPEKIAVFDNGQIDNLDALGFGDRIVATATDILPSHLEKYSDLPVAGTLHEIDLETAYETEPDLAIVAGRSRDSFDGLSEFVPTVDFSNNIGNTTEAMSTNLKHYGQIFDVEEEAQSILTDLETQMNQLNEEASESGLSTLFVMFNEGSLSAYGPGSRFGLIHDSFGFEPVDPDIESSNHGMDISFEYVLEQDPDVLFVLDRTSAIGGEQTSASLEENPLIKETSAYQNDNIIYLTPDVWYLSEGGVQAFETMMNEAATAIK